MRSQPTGYLFVMLAMAACGGRYVQTQSDGGDDDDSGTAGKPASHAGSKGSSGGSSSSGGKPAMGGVSSAGAPVTMPGCMCPDIDCPPDSVAVPNPNGCCFSCQRNDCDETRAYYLDFEQQVLEKYSSAGCMTDGDCGTLFVSNACSSNCGTPLPTRLFMDAVSTLDTYAAMACNLCPPPPIQPCPMPPPPACFQGRCVFLTR